MNKVGEELEQLRAQQSLRMFKDLASLIGGCT